MSAVIPPAESGRDNNFNLLRLLLAVLVLLSHAPELVDGDRRRELLTRAFGTLSFGELAVDGFFILSGFLIVRSWQTQPAAGAFMRKRAARIYPGFWVATLISAFVVGPLAADPARYFNQLSLPLLLGGMAVLIPPVVPPVFQGQSHPFINGSMWTISAEFICYILVMLMGIWRAIERRYIWLMVTVLWGGLLAYQRFGDLTPWPMGLRYEFSSFRLLFAFFAGGCFELYRERISFTPALEVLALLLVVAGLTSRRWCELVLPVAGGYLLLAAAFKEAVWAQPLRKLPDISYGAYLYGWPVQKLMCWYWPGISPWFMLACTCVACAVMGWLSWRWVERPGLRFRPYAAR